MCNNLGRRSTKRLARSDLRKWVCMSLLSVICLRAGVPSPACEVLTEESRARLTAYVLKLIKAPVGTSLQIQTAAPENETCFRRLEFISSDQKKFTLFLSPDQRFIIPRIFDSNIDPALAERKAIESTKTQIDRYIETTGSPIRGPADAPITIAMFSDFQCPFCRRAMDILETDVLPKTVGRVRLAYIHYPLAAHPWANEAAIALACVAKQSSAAFWTSQDYVFVHQSEITVETVGKLILSQAKSITDPRIDVGTLEQCLQTKATMQEVQADAAFGSMLNITATPTFFINGKRLIGLANAEQILSMINGFTGATTSIPRGR